MSRSKAKSSKKTTKKRNSSSVSALDPATEAARQLALPAYQDAVRPFAQQLGKAGHAVGGLVNALIAPLALSAYAYQQAEPHIKKKIAQSIEKRLADIPENKIIAPSPRIAVPAIQSFVHAAEDEEIADMFANLIASSMNVDSATNVHPSFVQIISNLTSDEALALKAFGRHQQFPLIDVQAYPKEAGGGYRVINKNFSHIGKIAGCSRPDLMPSYLDNLVKEGLVEIPSNIWLTDETKYKPLEEDQSIQQLKTALDSAGLRTEFARKVTQLTPYGQQFVSVSITEDKNETR